MTAVTPLCTMFARDPWGVTCFVSGASAPADIRGLSRFSVPLGVSLAELSDAGVAELLAAARIPLQRVFVDSGAFSEVEIQRGRPVVSRPIDDATWRQRLAVTLRIAAAFGERAVVVAPDCVGNQAETLARLTRYRSEVQAIAATGARVVLPLQRGAMVLANFEPAAADAAGLENYAVGITGNKDATPPAELESYLRASKPRAAHLLGVGPRSRRLQPLLDTFRRLSPKTEITTDANLLAALVGRSNGRGGAPRSLTAWQDHYDTEGSEKAREDAVAMVFGPSRMLWLTMDEMVRRGRMSPPRERPLQRGLFDGVGG